MARRKTRARRVRSWWATGLVLGLGGALFVFLSLWLGQAVGEVAGGGRLINEVEAGLGAMGVTGALMLLASIWGLGLIARWGCGTAVLAAGAWTFGLGLLWLVSLATGGVSLPVFLTFWLGFGLLGGWLARDRGPAPAPARPRPASARRRGEPVVRSGQFGRVPSETVVLLTRQVGQVQTLVQAGLPTWAPDGLRGAAGGAVLERTVRDWWENGNSEGLRPQDGDDLRSFVALAAALVDGVGAIDVSLQSDEGQAIFRATLAALLDDWLANWNANGVDGPPRRA